MDTATETTETPAATAEASPGMPTPTPTPTPKPTPEELVKAGWTSTVPYEDGEPECFVIACSDHRYRSAMEDFLDKALGFKTAHMVLVPSGVALADPLVTTAKFLTQAVDKVIERVVQAKNVRDIICIAHEGCGAYSVGKIQLINLALQRFARKTPEEIQVEHLRGSCRRIRTTISGVRVRAFVAKLVGEGEHARVNFREVEL